MRNWCELCGGKFDPAVTSLAEEWPNYIIAFVGGEPKYGHGGEL